MAFSCHQWLPVCHPAQGATLASQTGRQLESRSELKKTEPEFSYLSQQHKLTSRARQPREYIIMSDRMLTNNFYLQFFSNWNIYQFSKDFTTLQYVSSSFKCPFRNRMTYVIFNTHIFCPCLLCSRAQWKLRSAPEELTCCSHCWLQSCTITQVLPKKEDFRVAFQTLFRYSGTESSNQPILSWHISRGDDNCH